MRIFWFSLNLLACATLAACASTTRNIGPNEVDGSGAGNTSASGLIYALAGDRSHLYAASLNAGIWTRFPGRAWSQLANSSTLTTAVAVDPLDPSHVVSADRNGNASERDSSRFDLELAGIRESHDFGATWQFTYSPLTRLTSPNAPTACNALSSVAIPALAFSPSGTLFAGTSCGIGRRATGTPSFDFGPTPADIGLVTAFAAGREGSRVTHLWALARRLSNSRFVLLHSSDDGTTWDRVADIPAVLRGAQIGIPQGSGMAAPRGDEYSLAAFDAVAVTVFAPKPDRQNHSELLYYDYSADRFFAQELDNANDGTGGGGRRSIRSFPLRPPFEIGNGARIFFDAAQDVLEGTGIDLTGRITWKVVARAASDPIHPDIWDVLPDGEGGFWLATDGGVYKKDQDFSSFNDGLATHHIHTVTALNGSAARPGNATTNIAYATSDNDAWYKSGFKPWSSYRGLGDANWTAGDSGNGDLAILVRHATDAQLTDFDLGAPSGSTKVGGAKIALACVKALDDDGKEICGGYGIQQVEWRVIQTRRADPSSFALLDVVRLATLPLQIKDGDSVVDLSSGPLFDSLSKATSSTVLLRNTEFAGRPDVNQFKYEGWKLEDGGLPAGASRLWAVAGHGYYPPTYYVCVCQPAAGSPVQIFRQTQRGTTWTETVPTITQDGHAKNLDILPPRIEDWGQSLSGPLYVDQYNGRLALATRQGIAFYDPNGGWSLDAHLTAMLTDSGRYPLDSGFSGGTGTDVILATRGLPMMYVSDVAFYEDMQMAVSSPFTGIFYRKTAASPWLRAELGASYTPISAMFPVGRNAVDLFFGTEGRGLRETVNVDKSRVATYFDLRRRAAFLTAAGVTVRLARSDGSAMSGKVVKALFFHTDGSGGAVTLTTDADGTVPPNPQFQSGDRIFLQYEGDSTSAPSATAFKN